MKQLREWWLYWRYRNITRRWLLLKPRLKNLSARRQPRVPAGARARGTALYASTRGSQYRGLYFAAITSAILAVLNVIIGTIVWLDLLLFIGLSLAYIQYAGV